MFTGIITAIGTLKSISNLAGDRIYEVEGAFNADKIDIGASICHSGACLTVIEKGYCDNGAWWKVQVSEETIRLTNMGDWKIDTKINLEPSLKMGDELGGHIVTGHVDGIGEVIRLVTENESHVFEIKVPDELSRFIAKKGSVAVNGVSLTVNEVSENSFTINIIPHTMVNTTFGLLNLGTKVNLEVDPLARYAARWLSFEK